MNPIVMNKFTKPIVIGAGPAGLAFASHFTALGGQCTLIEASPFVGGMARSFSLWGGLVDLGPHRFFSTDPIVNAYWHKHVRDDYVVVSRLTRIFYDGKFYRYPLDPKNALNNLGMQKAISSVLSFLLAKFIPPRDDGSLENWISRKFGRVLYRTFFKVYTEKVWGIDCKLIDADWAAQRIQGLTLWKAIKGALRRNKGNSLKTLVDEFAYPKQGNQLFYDRQLEHIRSGRNKVLIETRVKRILIEDNAVKGIELADETILTSNCVVSSMPLTSLVLSLKNVPENVRASAQKLRFRNTILVYLRVRAEEIFKDQWLYIHDPNLLHGRITNFNNWSPEISPRDGTTTLCLEFWCFDGDAIWEESDEDLIARAKLEVGATKLVSIDQIMDGKVIKLQKSYPVYDRGYKEHLQVVTNYLDQIDGLFLIGRYGSFKYNNQDHSILMGLLAAEAIFQGKTLRLWHINTDSTYQEAAKSAVLTEPLIK